MKVGDKVFIDNVFKNGYIYSFDNITNKYRVVVVKDGINSFYDVEERYLYKI